MFGINASVAPMATPARVLLVAIIGFHACGYLCGKKHRHKGRWRRFSYPGNYPENGLTCLPRPQSQQTLPSLKGFFLPSPVHSDNNGNNNNGVPPWLIETTFINAVIRSSILPTGLFIRTTTYSLKEPVIKASEYAQKILNSVFVFPGTNTFLKKQ